MTYKKKMPMQGQDLYILIFQKKTPHTHKLQLALFQSRIAYGICMSSFLPEVCQYSMQAQIC